MPISFLKSFLGDIHYALNIREHSLATYLTPSEKREVLLRYASSKAAFVETGTYQGETTAVMAKHFREVHTIEVDRGHFERARDRFSNEPTITCYHGDSAALLPSILKRIEGPIVFWLDGHYSGPRAGRANGHDTPILQELTAVFSHDPKNHVILIDDARLFVGRKSYPRIATLRRFVREKSRYLLTVRDDIIRLIHDPEWS